MLYYLYLKRQAVKGQSDYLTLTRINYDNEIRPGMSITFDLAELYQFSREYPELSGMRSTYRVVKVYECDGMGGIILE